MFFELKGARVIFRHELFKKRVYNQAGLDNEWRSSDLTTHIQALHSQAASEQYPFWNEVKP